MKSWGAKWVGWFRVFAFAGLLFGLIIRIADPFTVETLRNAAFDVYHQTKPRSFVQMPVAILDVDDRSIEALGQWPWPRSRVAELVDKATAAGAVAIGFDIIFAEPDRLSPAQILADNPAMSEPIRDILSEMPDNDALLADAFARSRVIVGQTSVRSVAGNREQKHDLIDVRYATIGPDPRPFLLQFPDIVQNLPELEHAAAGRGMFNARPDGDGVYRRVPLVMSVQNEIRLGLTPEILRIATGAEPFAIRTNGAGVEGVILARQLVATAHDGTVWPYLSPSVRARFISAVDLLDGTMSKDRLAGHMVLVGTSAIGLEDFRATPLGVSMAGVEIHAQVLENIMAKTLLVRPNYTIAIELVTIFVLCSLVIVFAPVMSARALIFSSLALLATYVGVSYYLFSQYRMLLDPSFPVLATATTTILVSAVNYLREERQKRAIRGAFGQYVSPDLVDQLSKNQGQLTLGGESREITLLFSDVRGFTAIAEDFRDDPVALTALMNQFLTILSKAILEQKGTIDKFMGDAVMAFWNAPLDNEDHLRAACRAGLRMRTDIEKFNSDRMAKPPAPNHQPGETQDRTPLSKRNHRLNVGIGINTGQCVVGNMGSDTRFDYTALGDPVNVASRLEGQSRYYGAPIILGQNTANKIRTEFAVLELDMIRVVGKELPENIFALLGDETFYADARFGQVETDNAAMLTAYRAQDWDAAESALQKLRVDMDGMGIDMKVYVDLYSKRITDLRAAPPGAGWDGVFASNRK